MFMLQKHQSLQLVSCMSCGFALGFCLKKVKVHRTGNPTRRRLWRISCWCAPELPTVPTVQCTFLFLSTNAEFHVGKGMEFRNCFICNALRTPSFQGELTWLLYCLMLVNLVVVSCFKIFWARGRACQSWSDASYVEGQPNLTCWISSCILSQFLAIHVVTVCALLQEAPKWEYLQG